MWDLSIKERVIKVDEKKIEISKKNLGRASDLIRFKDDEEDELVQDNAPADDSFDEVLMKNPVDETLVMLEKAENDFENALDAFSGSMEQLFDLLEKIIENNREQLSGQETDER